MKDHDCFQSREDDVGQAKDDGDEINRRAVLRDIKSKLLEYLWYEDIRFRRLPIAANNSVDEVLIKAQKIEAFQRPSDRNHRSVRPFCYNTQPLGDK